MIEKAHKDRPAFKEAARVFLEHAHEAINPNLTEAVVREMLIQHIGYEKVAPAQLKRADNFHQEGFVNQFAMVQTTTPNTVVFESEALENVPKGWKARETYEIISPDEFTETFEIASTGAYEAYSRNRFKRKSSR